VHLVAEILKQISARWKSIGAEEKEVSVLPSANCLELTCCIPQKYEKRAEEDTRRHAKEYHEYQKVRMNPNL
jgi:hypothetical protein